MHRMLQQQFLFERRLCLSLLHLLLLQGQSKTALKQDLPAHYLGQQLIHHLLSSAATIFVMMPCIDLCTRSDALSFVTMVMCMHACNIILEV